jgi:hypothetical protein
MIASTRRQFAAVLLGLGMGGAGALPRPALAAPPLPLPEGPLRLLRVLERGMGTRGAAAITVRRWWEVRFERQARGILATGRQIRAEVDAPPRLAELAAIEQRRDASAMFPLMLSAEGAIITPPSEPGESDAVRAAMRAAEELIARQALPSVQRERIALYLAQVHRAGSGLLDSLPGDLLFPSGEPVERSDTVELPDGLTGRFTLRYAAVPVPGAPWLSRAERRVSTMVGNHLRRAVETWTLAPPEP